MSKLHGKSVLLGIGIGIILTAMLGIIFFLGYTPDMDEAKVKKLAKQYGMVEPSEQEIPLFISIAEGDSITNITNKLAELGIIDNIVSFQIKIVNGNAKNKIMPGIYEFRGNESEDEIIDILIGSND